MFCFSSSNAALLQKSITCPPVRGIQLEPTQDQPQQLKKVSNLCNKSDLANLLIQWRLPQQASCVISFVHRSAAFIYKQNRKESTNCEEKMKSLSTATKSLILATGIVATSAGAYIIYRSFWRKGTFTLF